MRQRRNCGEGTVRLWISRAIDGEREERLTPLQVQTLIKPERVKKSGKSDEKKSLNLEMPIRPCNLQRKQRLKSANFSANRTKIIAQEQMGKCRRKEKPRESGRANQGKAEGQTKGKRKRETFIGAISVRRVCVRSNTLLSPLSHPCACAARAYTPVIMYFLLSHLSHEGKKGTEKGQRKQMSSELTTSKTRAVTASSRQNRLDSKHTKLKFNNLYQSVTDVTAKSAKLLSQYACAREREGDNSNRSLDHYSTTRD